MRIECFILLSTLLLFSCKNIESGELVEISIDVEINKRILLSEIAEEITTVNLELTNESIINTDQILKALLLDSLVFIAEMNQMLVFDIEGRFIRSIGSIGQGPGEYNSIENNKIIYINDRTSIISYDLNGNNSKYSSEEIRIEGRKKMIRPINNNTELFYYFDTHINPDDDVEHNPTLYIGKLKK